jgi:CDP-diacylglycerol---serine O-phosphatidyltransferase
MKRSLILPNIVTAFSLSCGLFVIFKMSSIPPGTATFATVQIAVMIVLLAAFFDLLDGAIARAMKVESEFGGLFDSLSDAISFGVAPAVVILKTLSAEPKTFLSFFLTCSAMIYSICGVLRLVRFTVTNQKYQGTKEEIAHAKANFTGLPIPAAAAVSLSTTLFLMSDEAKSLYDFTSSMRVNIASFVFLLLGYFMISRWKFPSLKSLRLRVGSFQVVLLTAVAAALILITAVNSFSVLFAGISWAYLLLAWSLSLFRVISGRKLKALEDFEPDQDEDTES